MAGYRETFGANVDVAYNRGLRDITGQLERGMSRLSGAGSFVSQLGKQFKDAQGSARNLTNEITTLQQQMAQTTPGTPQWLSWNKQLMSAQANLKSVRRSLSQMPFDALEKGLSRVVKGLISFNTSLLGLAFDFVISSIKRVYELQERWTKAIGGFNMKIGGMSSGLKSATKAAVEWSSTVRGLTNGDIQEGIQMFGEFTDAIGSTIDKGVEFQKFGLQMARGFNLGASGAGQLTKVLSAMGDNMDDATKFGAQIVDAANSAHESTNALAKDLLEGSTYMARFGKEGQKTFVQGAAWVRKYNITISQLKASVEGMDMFDEAAKTASKLNAAFGTMINSMDQMLEDDPAKRLDMIRQQMLAQGMTYDKLSPKQRRYFSETLHLTEEQTAALLDSRNANESYSDFLAKSEKEKKAELNAQKTMQKQLQSTVQTMYAFGAAFDRVTVAIAKAIRPLLEELGLVQKNDKQWKSFGQVMESITKTVIHFFESLAGDEKWMSFMKELANDLRRAGSALKEFVMSGRAASFVGDLAVGMKSFYTSVRDLAIKAVPYLKPVLDVIMALSHHIGALSIAAGALKGFNALGGAGGMPGKFLGRAARTVGGGSMVKGIGRLGFAGAAGAVGGMIGGAGAGVGAGVGGLAGSFMGPIGTILGPIVGGLVGKAVDWLFGSSKVKTALERAHEELEETIEKENKKREALNSVLDAVTQRQTSSDKIRTSQNKILQAMEDNALKQKDKSLVLNDAEIEMLRQRANELTLFSKSTKISKDMLEKLSSGSKLTADQIADLLTGSKNYEDELAKLRDATKQQADLEMSRLQVSNLGQQKEALELTTKLHDMELKTAKAQLEQAGGKVGRGGLVEKGLLGGARVMAAGVLEQEKKGLVKLTDDERKRLELEAKIDKLNMQNSKDQQDLIEKQTQVFKGEVIIKLRQAIKSDAEFLDFQKSSAEQGKTVEQQMEDFVASGKSVLGNNPEIRALISQGLDLGGISPLGSTTARPATFSGGGLFDKSPGVFQNYAAPSQSTQSPIVVHSTIVLDGKEVGRSDSLARGFGQNMLQVRP